MKRTLVGGLVLLLSAALAGSGCSGYYGTSVEARYSSGYHSADWYYRDGLRLYRLGYYDRAIVQFRLAIDLEPDYWEAHYYLGDCYYNIGQYDRAVTYYDRVLVLHSDPVWVTKVNYNIGLVYEKTGKYDRAVERYDRALKVKPGYGPAKQAKTRLLKSRVKDVEKGNRDRGRGRGRGRDKD